MQAIFDEPVKSRETPVLSFRTWSGIQSFQYVLDTGVRRYDDIWTFYGFVIFYLTLIFKGSKYNTISKSKMISRRRPSHAWNAGRL